MRVVIIKPGLQLIGGYTSIVLEDVCLISSDDIEGYADITFDGSLSFQRRQVIIRELKAHFAGFGSLLIEGDTLEDAKEECNLEIRLHIEPQTQILITMEGY